MLKELTEYKYGGLGNVGGQLRGVFEPQQVEGLTEHGKQGLWLRLRPLQLQWNLVVFVPGQTILFIMCTHHQLIMPPLLGYRSSIWIMHKKNGS
jgi:hypothetical protein